MKIIVLVVILAVGILAQIYEIQHLEEGLVLSSSGYYYWDFDIWERVFEEGRPIFFKMQGTAAGLIASPLSPDYKYHNFTYSKAVALFKIPEFDPSRDVKWYLFFHPEHQPSATWEALRHYSVVYNMRVTIRIGDHLRVRWLLEALCDYELGSKGLRLWKLINVTETVEIYSIDIGYAVFYNGSTYLYVRFVNYTLGKKPWWISKHMPFKRANALNFTVATFDWGAVAYVNGTPIIYISTSPRAPKPAGTELVVVDRSSAEARPWVFVSNLGGWGGSVGAWINLYLGAPLKSLGEVYLLVGNETLSPPRYIVYPVYGTSIINTTLQGFGVSAQPPPTLPSPSSHYRQVPIYVEIPVVDFEINGVKKKLPLGTVLPRCEEGTPVYSGVTRLFDAYVINGSGYYHCSQYRVHVTLPNGTTLKFTTPPKTTFEYNPPPFVELHNKTRLVNPVPIRLEVNYSDVYINATYQSKEYLIVVNTPFGQQKIWAREKSTLNISGVEVELDNNTKVVTKPISIFIDSPKDVNQEYTRYYPVEVVTPSGSTRQWIQEGTYFEYKTPSIVNLGNGTIIRAPNSTCAFVVDRPRRCEVDKIEKLYRVTIRTPFGELVDGWLPAGQKVTVPEVYVLENGTRFVEPTPAYVEINNASEIEVVYKKQYFIYICGAIKWKGWADAGSEIRLNETTKCGVTYKPLQPTIVVNQPGVYEVPYMAVVSIHTKDLLGFPNPWARAILCDKVFQADIWGRIHAEVETSDYCCLKVEATPIGPFSVITLTALLLTIGIAIGRKVVKRGDNGKRQDEVYY